MNRHHLCRRTLFFRVVVAAVAVLLAALFVPSPVTPAAEPAACLPTGEAGEYVLNFDGFPVGDILNGVGAIGGTRFMGDDTLTVVEPTWEDLPDMYYPPPVSHQLLNDPGAREFGSTSMPLRIGFAGLVDSVSVSAGLLYLEEGFTATMIAYGFDAAGRRIEVDRDEMTLGLDGVNPVCLRVEEAGQIFEVVIDYGFVMQPELIDNLIVRLSEGAPPVPVDETPPVVAIESPEGGAVVTGTFVRLEGTITEDRELLGAQLWINDVLWGELGFSPIGESTYFFGVDAIPASDLVNCGPNAFEVFAYDREGNQGNDQIAFRLSAGDLEVVGAEPVQVLYGAPLVQGKATAFRVTVNSTFCSEVEAEFRLGLPADQWETTAPASPMNIEAVPSDWRMPEVSGPVAIPAGASGFQIMLPFIPEGMADAPWDPVTNPYGRIDLIRAVPRPAAATVMFSIDVDPNGAYDEADESDNRFSSPAYETVTTRGVSVVFIGQAWDSAEIAAASRFDNEAQFITRLPDYAEQQMDYLLGTYPVADAKVTWRVLPTLYFRADYESLYRAAPPEQDCWSVTANYEKPCNPCFSDMMSSLIQGDPSTSHFDAVALVQPFGCCGCNSAGIAFYAEDDGAADGNVTHELGHQDNSAWDCYACRFADGRTGCVADGPLACESCHADEGFWVNHWHPYDESAWYYMDCVRDPSEIWTRLGPCRLWSTGAEASYGYLHLMGVMRRAADPPAVVVRGALSAGGTATFAPFLRVDEAVVDLSPDSAGTHAIVFVDDTGAVLASHGFTPDFTTYLEPEGAVQTESIRFSYRIAWVDGVTAIELRDAAGAVLASQAVSAQTPSVQLLSPNGGEQWHQGGQEEVRWEGTDPDGDSLTYALWISDDDGETWQPLAIDIAEASYAVDTTGFPLGDTFRLKVRVTDGVNTGVDASDASFSVLEGEAAPGSTTVPGTTVPAGIEDEGAPGWVWPAVGAGAAGLAGLGLVAYGLGRRRRGGLPPPAAAAPPPPPEVPVP